MKKHRHSLVFGAMVFLTTTPTLAREYRDCLNDRDCQSGWICDVDSIPCQTNPQASECVRKACVPGTQSQLNGSRKPQYEDLHPVQDVASPYTATERQGAMR